MADATHRNTYRYTLRNPWRSSLLICWGLCSAGLAQADLLGRDADGNAANGSEAYFDTVLGITWLADANHAYSSGQAAGSFGAMTWTDTQAWLSGSVNAGGGLYGVTTWRLPTTTLANPPGYTWSSGLADYANGTADYGINHSQPSNELGFMYSVNLGLRAHADTAGVDYPSGSYGLDSTSVQQSNTVLGGFYNTAQLVDLTVTATGVTFRQISTDALWTDTTVTDDPQVGSGTSALYLQTNDGHMDVMPTVAGSFSNTAAAWLVADGDVLATAVPEPDSLALMLGGLGVLGWRRHRRGRSY